MNRHDALRAAAATPTSTLADRVVAARADLIKQMDALTDALAGDDHGVDNAQRRQLRSAAIRLAAAADAA